jgi:hypothetical protein
MKYFIKEPDLATLGPITAQSALEFIQCSKTPLEKLLVRDQDRNPVDLQMLCNRAYEKQVLAQRTTAHNGGGGGRAVYPTD